MAGASGKASDRIPRSYPDRNQTQPVREGLGGKGLNARLDHLTSVPAMDQGTISGEVVQLPHTGAVTHTPQHTQIQSNRLLQNKQLINMTINLGKSWHL